MQCKNSRKKAQKVSGFIGLQREWQFTEKGFEIYAAAEDFDKFSKRKE